MTREERAIQILEQRQCCRECVVENCTCAECDKAFEMAIKSLEQEPRKGHWIYDKSLANWVCSKCGETPKTIGYVGTGAFMAEHFKYCNHCGAEMEGSEEV